MASPEYKTSTQNDTVAAASFVINKPADLQDNDLLIACVSRGDDTPAIGIPVGWTQLYQQNTTTGRDLSSVICYKYITSASGEGANYTWTGLSGQGGWGGAILRIEGTRQGDLIDVSSAKSDDTIDAAGTATCSDITTTETDTLIIVATALTNAAATDADVTVEAGSTTHEAVFRQDGNICMGSKAQANIDTYSGTVDYDGHVTGAEWHGYQIALNALLGSPSPSISPSISASISPSLSLSASISSSISLSISPSMSPSISPSASLSPSISLSLSPSISLSLSPSVSPSPSPFYEEAIMSGGGKTFVTFGCRKQILEPNEWLGGGADERVLPGYVPTNGNKIIFRESFEEADINLLPGVDITGHTDNSNVVYVPSVVGSNSSIDADASGIGGRSGTYCEFEYKDDIVARSRLKYDGNFDTADIIGSFRLYLNFATTHNEKIIFQCRIADDSEYIEVITTIDGKIYLEHNGVQVGNDVAFATGEWHRVEFYRKGTNTCGWRFTDNGVVGAVQEADEGASKTLDKLYFGGSITNLQQLGVSARKLYIDNVMIAAGTWETAADWIDDAEGALEVVTDSSDLTFVEVKKESDDSTDRSGMLLAFEDPDETLGDPKAKRVFWRGQQYDTSHYECVPFIRKEGLGVASTPKSSGFSPGGEVGDAVWADFYFLAVNDPEGDGAWSWAQIKEAYGYIRASAQDFSGYRISDCYAEVISGATGDAFVTHEPLVACVSSTELRIWLRISEASSVRIRYGTVEGDVKTNSGDTDTSSATAITATDPKGYSKDFTAIVPITGLTANKTYYYDILVEQKNGCWQSAYELEGGASAYYWSTLPSCKTFQAPGTRSDMVVAAGADEHHQEQDHNVFTSMSAKTPDLVWKLGDEWSISPEIATVDEAQVIRNIVYERRGSQLSNYWQQFELYNKYPAAHIFSDHDFLVNNANCVGGGNYDDALNAYMVPTALRVYKEMTPLPDLHMGNNYEGAHTDGSDVTLVDTSPPEFQITYDAYTGNLTQGEGVTWGIDGVGTLLHDERQDGTGTYQLVIEYTSGSYPSDDEVVIGDDSSAEATIDGSYGFPTVSKYGLYPGQCIRYLDETDESVCEYSFVKYIGGTTIHFCQALSDGKDFSTTENIRYLVQRASLCHTFDMDNIRFIVIDIRHKRDPNWTFGGCKLDTIAYGLVINQLSKPLVGGNTVDDQDSMEIDSVDTHNIFNYTGDLTSFVNRWDMVEVRTAADGEGDVVGHFLVEEVTDTYVKIAWETCNDDTVEANHFMYFYESGSSIHSTPEEAINAGHIFRTFVEDIFTDRTDPNIDYYCLVSETPIFHGEAGQGDKWCDYDGMCFWIELLDEIGVGDTQWEAIDDVDGTRMRSRKPFLNSDGGALKPGAVARDNSLITASRTVMEEVFSADEIDGNEQVWYWNAGEKKVEVDDVIPAESTTIQIYKPDFWRRCAAREYNVRQWLAHNGIGLGGDRHCGFLDDGSHADDGWPNIGASPLGRHASIISCRQYRVGGYRSYYHAGMAANHDYLSDPIRLISFAHIQILNSEEKWKVEICERLGAVVNNATESDGIPDEPPDPEFMGLMTMDFSFESRVISETFDPDAAVDDDWDSDNTDQSYWEDIP